MKPTAHLFSTLSPAGMLIYGFLSLGVEDGMRRRECNPSKGRFMLQQSRCCFAKAAHGVITSIAELCTKASDQKWLFNPSVRNKRL